MSSPASRLRAAVVIVALASLPGVFRARRRPRSYGRELEKYRRELTERTTMIDSQLAKLVDLVDALRRHDVEPDDALEKLQAGEELLDEAADNLRDILAPEELHALHADYEANLERALRGIVTAERGCGITKMRHRPPEDEEPMIYWKRGHLNILHARLRMQELVAGLLTWEPGMPAEATVAARLGRR
jgi:exonuclease VII small subunit